MKIWLDDIRPAPEGFYWAKTAREAVELLHFIGLDGIDVISFDHDLGENEDTGYDVVKWIEEEVYFNRPNRLPIMWIHSDNGPGIQNIMAGINSIIRRFENEN